MGDWQIAVDEETHARIQRGDRQAIDVANLLIELRQAVVTHERIIKFEYFTEDESLVGEQCNVCLEDIKVGTEMARLSCHASHYFCRTCTLSWFKYHKTCPICRNVFN